MPFCPFSPSSANVLFFGCRSESKDFYCRDEWEQKIQAGHMTLFTAFSRDQVSRTRTSPDRENNWIYRSQELNIEIIILLG